MTAWSRPEISIEPEISIGKGCGTGVVAAYVRSLSPVANPLRVGSDSLAAEVQRGAETVYSGREGSVIIAFEDRKWTLKTFIVKNTG